MSTDPFSFHTHVHIYVYTEGQRAHAFLQSGFQFHGFLYVQYIISSEIYSLHCIGRAKFIRFHCQGNETLQGIK